MKINSKITFFVLLFLSQIVIQTNADDNPQPTQGYHNYSELTAALKELANQNNKITKLMSIGKTLNGRDILIIQVSVNYVPKPQEKQALLICGNLEGDFVIGSEVALGIAEYLIKGYGEDANVTNTLNKRTLREYFFGIILFNPGLFLIIQTDILIFRCFKHENARFLSKQYFAIYA